MFPTILLVCGKVNFTNLSRYSDLSEKTYRRQYRQVFNFPYLNAQMIQLAIPSAAVVVGAMDCSFIPKSGKKTYGLDWFYNGSASRSQKGLEISVIALIDVAAHRGYSLSVQQTPADLRCSKATVLTQAKGITWATIEQAQQMLQQLPSKSPSALLPEIVASEITRIDHYLAHLKNTYAYLPPDLKYWVVDGFYSKKKFVDGVLKLNLQMISKLRSDADMRYLYTGVQKPRGAKRKYDGKVDLSELSRFTHLKQLVSQIDLYTTVVWHVSLKRRIRLACLVDTRKAGKTVMSIGLCQG